MSKVNKDKLPARRFIDKLSINSIADIRTHLVRTLTMLHNQEIDVSEAATTYKLCEGYISSMKVELEYANALGKQPFIKELQACVTEKDITPKKNKPKYFLDK